MTSFATIIRSAIVLLLLFTVLTGLACPLAVTGIAQAVVNEHANASFNAKSGSHDDLVIALGLSCGIERSGARVTSRSYIEPDPDQARPRSRWAKQRLEGR